MFICINVYCMAKCGPCQNRNVPFNVKDALLLLLQPPSRGKLMLDMAANKYSKEIKLNTFGKCIMHSCCFYMPSIIITDLFTHWNTEFSTKSSNFLQSLYQDLQYDWQLTKALLRSWDSKLAWPEYSKANCCHCQGRFSRGILKLADKSQGRSQRVSFSKNSPVGRASHSFLVIALAL